MAPLNYCLKGSGSIYDFRNDCGSAVYRDSRFVCSFQQESCQVQGKFSMDHIFRAVPEI